MNRATQTPAHALQIKSFYDLIAECSCGRWHYARTTTQADRIEDLTRLVIVEHQLHIGAQEGQP